jgi:hypothetical protein
MKKNYILTLEFEAVINETIPIEEKEKMEFFTELLKELLKNDRAVYDIYRLWLMSDLRDGDHMFRMEWDIANLKDSILTDYIKPVLQNLPEKIKEHFDNILAMDADSINRYFDLLFVQFGPLIITKGDFIEKIKPE